MEIQNDFKELFELFNAHNVQYPTESLRKKKDLADLESLGEE